jgi:hypothetical protein
MLRRRYAAATDQHEGFLALSPSKGEDSQLPAAGKQTRRENRIPDYEAALTAVFSSSE